MLKGISPLLSPELLATLTRMGHGDEIVLADAHFPGESFNDNVLRADGLRIPDLLEAILPLFELDSYVPHPLVMMAAVEGDLLDPSVEESYLKAIHKSNPDAPAIERIDRFAFYERTKKCFCGTYDRRNSKIREYYPEKGLHLLPSF